MMSKLSSNGFSWLRKNWFLVVTVFMVGGWVAHAEMSDMTSKKFTRSAGEIHDTLTKMLEKQDKERDAEREKRQLIERLCREGKLPPDSDECVVSRGTP
jgi:hypothetical protein